MPPPQLPADAPGSDAPHPVKIDITPAFGHKPNPSVFHGRDRGLYQTLHVHEPLQRQKRFDGSAAAVAGADGVAVVLGLHEQALLLQALDDGVAGFGGAQPFELAGLRGHEPIEADHGYAGKAVTQTDLPVVRVVTRGDLERTGPEADIHVLVGDDGHLPAHQRHHRGPSHETPVARVLGIDRHRGVPQDGLRSRGGHRQGLI